MSRFGSVLMWKLSLFAEPGEAPPPPPPPLPKLSRDDGDDQPSAEALRLAGRNWFPVDTLPIALDGRTHGWAHTLAATEYKKVEVGRRVRGAQVFACLRTFKRAKRSVVKALNNVCLPFGEMKRVATNGVSEPVTLRVLLFSAYISQDQTPVSLYTRVRPCTHDVPAYV